MMAALIRQPCPIFMWCRTVDIGAHHACWLLLQALFMTASVLTVTSTTATMTIASRVFIVASRPGHSPAGFSWFTNEPGVKVWRTRPLRQSDSTLAGYPFLAI